MKNDFNQFEKGHLQNRQAKIDRAAKISRDKKEKIQNVKKGGK